MGAVAAKVSLAITVLLDHHVSSTLNTLWSISGTAALHVGDAWKLYRVCTMCVYMYQVRSMCIAVHQHRIPGANVPQCRGG